MKSRVVTSYITSFYCIKSDKIRDDRIVYLSFIYCIFNRKDRRDNLRSPVYYITVKRNTAHEYNELKYLFYFLFLV